MTRLLIDDKDMIYIRMSGTNVSFECDLNYLSVAVSLTCRCCLSRIHMFLLYLLLLLSDFNIYSLVKWCSDLVAFHATVVLPLYLFISHMHHPTVFMSTAWVRVNSVVSKSCSTCYIQYITDADKCNKLLEKCNIIDLTGVVVFIIHDH